MRLRQKGFVCVFLALLLVVSVATMGVSADPETLLSVEPPEQTVPAGLPFTVNITVTNVANLNAFEFKLWYNSTVLTALDVTPSPIWGTDYWEVPNLEVPGLVWYGIIFVEEWSTFSGTGTLAKVTFNATVVGESFLHLNETIMAEPGITQPIIPHTTVDGTVEVSVFDLDGDGRVTILDVSYVAIAMAREIYRADFDLAAPYGPPINILDVATAAYLMRLYGS